MKTYIQHLYMHVWQSSGRTSLTRIPSPSMENPCWWLVYDETASCPYNTSWSWLSVKTLQKKETPGLTLTKRLKDMVRIKFKLLYLLHLKRYAYVNFINSKQSIDRTQTLYKLLKLKDLILVKDIFSWFLCTTFFA